MTELVLVFCPNGGTEVFERVIPLANFGAAFFLSPVGSLAVIRADYGYLLTKIYFHYQGEILHSPWPITQTRKHSPGRFRAWFKHVHFQLCESREVTILRGGSLGAP